MNLFSQLKKQDCHEEIALVVGMINRSDRRAGKWVKGVTSSLK